MCLIVRLKAHMVYFNFENIWSARGQRMLAKPVSNNCEKRKIVIFNIFYSKYEDEFFNLKKLWWRKTKSLFVIDEFCTINECIVIDRDLNSFPQVLRIFLLENLCILDFMAPKHYDMWMNSRYDLWYLFRHIWATFSFICGC